MRCVYLLDTEQFFKPWDHIVHYHPHFLFPTYFHEVLVFYHSNCRNPALQGEDIVEKNVMCSNVKIVNRLVLVVP